MTALNPEAGALDIGQVIQDIIAVLRRNWAPFLSLAAILIGIPAVLTGLVNVTVIEAEDWGHWPNLAFAGLIRLVSSLILQAALIYGAVADLNGKRPTVAQCLSVGLNDFLPVFAIGLLLGLAVLVGCILLVVPGIIIAVMWCVAVPAFVAEGTPVMQSFGRSSELTEGNRLRIFALFVIFVLASAVLQAVLNVFAFAAPMMRHVVVEPAVAVITGMVGATSAAVLYVELRRLKEGVPVERLASELDRKGPATS